MRRGRNVYIFCQLNSHQSLNLKESQFTARTKTAVVLIYGKIKYVVVAFLSSTAFLKSFQYTTNVNNLGEFYLKYWYVYL